MAEEREEKETLRTAHCPHCGRTLLTYEARERSGVHVNMRCRRCGQFVDLLLESRDAAT